MIYMTSYNSPLGSLFLAERDETILGLWITGQKYFLSSIKEPFERNTETPLLRQTKAWLNAYFSGKNPSVQDLPLARKEVHFSMQSGVCSFKSLMAV